ncbi:MAG TPA: ribose-5-phosphate isomerase RpiA [Thermohalobaculum sp.]|nr:ribose-5-phosphate isomerase RpiA [Thermohalobaculum sp.]
MEPQLSPSDRAKRAAALRALEMVEDGMRLGLGTGSTARWLVALLGHRIAEEGLKVTAVATSSATRALAAEAGVPLRGIDDVEGLDLTIDGADEFDARLTLIKGGGGALLWEKIVAAASARMVVIADPSKRVETLGTFPLPVEIVGFGHRHTAAQVRDLLQRSDVGGDLTMLRPGSGGPCVTDEGHHILDLHLGRIGDPARLNVELNAIPGVVETGLFVGMADTVVVGLESGEAEVIGRG